MESDTVIDKELLLEVAKKKGLKNKEFIEKDYFQDLFLFNLYRITNTFIFKGGTALYKLYNFPRFSEDLDFSFLGKRNADKIVEKVSKKIGAKIRSKKVIGDSLLFKLGFKGIITKYNTLRIDVNLKNPVFEKKLKPYVPPYVDLNPFVITTLSLKEMIAEKVHSLFSRSKARDLFDLFFLLRLVEADKVLIEKKLEVFGMRFDEKKLKKRIESLEDVWEVELKPFVLSELPQFKIVKTYVLQNLKEKSN